MLRNTLYLKPTVTSAPFEPKPYGEMFWDPIGNGWEIGLLMG
jgi:hypothetical protein